jgi:hypothetical protein
MEESPTNQVVYNATAETQAFARHDNTNTKKLATDLWEIESKANTQRIYIMRNFTILIFCLIGFIIINGCGPSKAAELKLTGYHELTFWINSEYESTYNKALEIAQKQYKHSEINKEIYHDIKKGVIKINFLNVYGVLLAIEIYGKEENRSFVVIYYWIDSWGKIAFDFMTAMLE